MVEKNLVTCRELPVRKVRHDIRYAALSSALRSTQHVITNPPSEEQIRSAKKKLFGVGIVVADDDFVAAKEKVIALLAESLNNSQKQALRDWRERVKLWHVGTSDLFRYLKNEAPSRVVALRVHVKVTAMPSLIHGAFTGFWGSLERWPSTQYKALALEQLEDHFGAFIPCADGKVSVSPHHLYQHIQSLRKTSSGPDGWTVSDLRALPLEAWSAFLQVVDRFDASPPDGTSNLFCRIPLEKSSSDVPTASEVRPIDIFSLSLRCLSSCQVASLIAWRMKVLHGGQYANKKGVVAALMRMGVTAACIRHQTRPRFALSIDFSKLFNMVDCDIVSRIMEMAGLDHHSVSVIMTTIRRAKGHWRLPRSEIGPFFVVERGVPQLHQNSS